MPTQYGYVKKPMTGAAAFQKTDTATCQSQAAVLLMMGRQLRGDDQALMARASASGAAMRRSTVFGVSQKAFPVPQMQAPAARMAVKTLHAGIRKRYGVQATKPAGGKWERAYGNCADDLYKKPTMESGAQLMELGLQHPMPLVRIAAAAAYHSMTTDPRRAVDLLVAGASSTDDLERELAATALARLHPDHAALKRLTRYRRSRGKPKPAHTATMVHGTWAANGTWWRPNGDFFSYVQTLRNDLYLGADRFRWTGAYSDGARQDAAQTLMQWVADHNVAGLDLFGHSHGANAIMLATQLGMRAGKLILLSCPVRVSQYFPNFVNTARVISIRVKLDLVILADRGGQKFSDARIEENVLPIWFNHSATHDPDVWRDNNLPTRI